MRETRIVMGMPVTIAVAGAADATPLALAFS
jgi:hypothetical protein